MYDSQPSKRALRVHIHAWQTGIRPAWSIGSVVTALREHRMGMLSGTSQMLDTMGEDDEIPSCIKERVNATIRAPLSFTGDSEEDNEWVDGLWCDIVSSCELFDFLRNALVIGVGIGVLDWALSESQWVPRLRNLPTEFLWRDESLGVWKYTAQEGEYVVTPGDGTWVMMTCGQRGWLYGYIRALALLWVAKQFTFRDWNRYNERHGLPIVKAKIPVSVQAGEKATFIQEVQDLNSEGVIGLPQGVDGPEVNYDLELLETKDQSWATFENSLNRSDRKIQSMLLGGNLGKEVATTGANRAASETHDNKLVKLASGDSEQLGKVLQDQIIKPLFFFNRGVRDEYPYPCYDAEPPEDIADRAVAQETFGKALAAIGTAGYRLTEKNLKELAAQFGLELEEKPEPVTPAPVVPPGARSPSGRGLSLASGDADAALEVQADLDDVADETVEEVNEVLKADSRTLLRLIKLSTSYEDMREKVNMAFDHLDVNTLSDVLERAHTLAALYGRKAVVQDIAVGE